MTPDSTTSSSMAPIPTPEPPVTPESILFTLESALAELTDLAVLIDTAKAAEAQLLKLFELYKRQSLSPAGINDLSKAVQVLYRLTSIRKTLIITVTSLIKCHASPKESQTAITQAISKLQNESSLRPTAPNSPVHETLADEVPEINEVSEVSEIGEINEIDEVGELDDPEELSDDELSKEPAPVCVTGVAPVIPDQTCGTAASAVMSDPSTPALAAQPTPNPHGSPVRDGRLQSATLVAGKAPQNHPESHRDGRNLPAPRPGSTPDSDADPNTSSLEFSPHSFVRGVRVCPWLSGLTEKELTRLLIYIGQLQAWEDRRQLWLRTPRRPPIWHPPAWGGFKLENTCPLQFPTHCFDPNFDPCRPATWPAQMLIDEYRRKTPFYPPWEYHGPIPPDPSATAPQPAADPPSADPHPTAPPPSAHAWVGDGSWEADAPIEDDWDADDAWAEDEPWDDATDDPHSSVPPDPG